MKTTRLVAAILLPFALAACAATGGAAGRKPEDAVRVRANELWQAKVAQNLEKTYSYEAPGYRATVPFDNWKRTLGAALVYKSAVVDDVVCETADKCKSYTKVEGTISRVVARNAPPLSTIVEETWVRDAGQWWLFTN